jgi:hypothetical protein
VESALSVQEVANSLLATLLHSVLWAAFDEALCEEEQQKLTLPLWKEAVDLAESVPCNENLLLVTQV